MGWMKGLVVAAVTAVAIFGAVKAGAEVRPIAFGPGSGEDSLQTILDNAAVGAGSPINAVADQSTYQVFTTASSAAVATQIIVEISGFQTTSRFGIYGTPYCGKGEPAQILRVGHAAPACVFAGVDVVGGA